jgi:hypothetical protein
MIGLELDDDFTTDHLMVTHNTNTSPNPCFCDLRECRAIRVPIDFVHTVSPPPLFLVELSVAVATTNTFAVDRTGSSAGRQPFVNTFFVKSMVTGQPSNCVTVDVIGLTNDTKSIITFQCADIFDDDFPKSLNDFYFDDGGFIVLLVQRH